MTYEFEYLMYLLSCGAKGIYAQQPKQELDWDLLLRLADEQSVRPVITYAINKSDLLCCPNQYRDRIISYRRSVTISATTRKIAIMNLLGVFKKNNVKAILLKGFAIADCYAIPESRISGDIHIWVSPNDEQKAYDILKDNDFTVEIRHAGSNYAVCHHPQMGYLDLYVMLYNKNDNKVKFRDINEADLIKEPYIEVDTVYGCYYTLGVTDHLIFLIMNLVKKFVSTGINLRMIMDIALLYKQNTETIDTGRLQNVINKLQCGELTDSLLNAMVIYCGFKKTELFINDDIPKDNVDIILSELEACEGKKGFSIYDIDNMPENKNAAFYMIKKYFRDLIFQSKKDTHVNNQR
jgi:hypothetical protein